MTSAPSPLPARFATPDLPGVGGRLRARDEDFLVDETPLYQPCGEGEFMYLFVEKQRLSTMDAVRILARHFGVPTDAVAYAGMKDKYAITRQHFSVHVKGRAIESFPSLRDPRLRVLWADRHTNRLKLGHLRGNRFSIKVRQVEPTDVVRAERVLRHLHRHGVPNYLGEQRFGARLRNHVIGMFDIRRDAQGLLDAMLRPDPAAPDRNDSARDRYARGDYAGALRALSEGAVAEREALRALARGATPAQAVGAISRMQRRFWLTALQSAVFNRVLDRRIERGALGELAPGDLAMKHENGACFRVDEGVAADPDTRERLARLAISPTGPMWGRKMTRPAGLALEDELGALADFGLCVDDLTEGSRHLGKLANGTRRALRVPLGDPEIEGGADEHGPYIRCAFDLPAGSFATVVMREVMKCEKDGAPEDEGDVEGVEDSDHA